MSCPIDNDDADKIWTTVLSSCLLEMEPVEAEVRSERLNKMGRSPFARDALPAVSPPKSVRFTEETDVTFVPLARELTIQEKVATWHTVRLVLTVLLYLLSKSGQTNTLLHLPSLSPLRMIRHAKAQEIFANRFECGRVVQMMRSGMRINEMQITTRGLESHQSDAYQAARRRRKEAVLRAVLDEQRNQRKLGLCYPQSLRVASLKASCTSRDIALEFGTWDAWIIRKELQIPTKEQQIQRKEPQTMPVEVFHLIHHKQIKSDSTIEPHQQELIAESGGSDVELPFRVAVSA